jgi:hypothetical protein
MIQILGAVETQLEPPEKGIHAERKRDHADARALDGMLIYCPDVLPNEIVAQIESTHRHPGPQIGNQMDSVHLAGRDHNE